MKKPNLKNLDLSQPVTDIQDEILERVYAANPKIEDQDAFDMADEIFEKLDLI